MGLSIKLKIIIVMFFLVLVTSIIVGMTVENYMTGKSDGQTRALAIIGATILIITGVIIVFAIKLIQPVDELIIGTQLVAQGRLDHKIRKWRNDEIGRLVDSFNRMIVKLRTSYEESTMFSNLANVEKQKAELIIDSMADSVIVTDEEHRIVLLNPAAENLFDINPTELISKHIVYMLKKFRIETLFEDFPEIREKILPERESSTKIRELELAKPNKKVLKASIAPLKSESNMIIGTVVVIEDITKAKELDEMKIDFVSTVSHELRTPLTSIKGYAALLADGRLGELNDRQAKSINIINKESDRLTDLVNDILDLSKLESGKAQTNFTFEDLKALTEKIPVLSIARSKGIRVRKTFPKTLPQVLLDKPKIVQVFNNLLSNAIKFTKSGGLITIKISDEKDHVRIDIIDTGVGIPKKEIPNLFNKFYQVESHLTRNQGGTGLGLPIVKEIIGLHHGLLSIKSKLHKGTTVSFALPKHELTSAELEQCWEKRGCKKIKCPAYQSDNKKCWLYIGTHCRKNSSEPCLDKIEICKYCDIYKGGLKIEEDTSS